MKKSGGTCTERKGKEKEIEERERRGRRWREETRIVTNNPDFFF